MYFKRFGEGSRPSALSFAGNDDLKKFGSRRFAKYSAVWKMRRGLPFGPETDGPVAIEWNRVKLKLRRLLLWSISSSITIT